MDKNPLSEDLEHVLEHTLPLWAELKAERLFITGGTGFFGSWLLESLTWAVDRLGLNTQAVVLTRDPGAFQRKAPHLADHAAVTLWPGDVRSFEFPAGRFSHVIHAATEASARLNAENPALMLDTIVEGTRRTLEFARRCEAANFLFTSSGAVYGPQPPEMTHIPEDYPGGPDPTQPGSAYGEGKRMAELLCTLYSNAFGIQTRIARCFAFVGPYLPLDSHFAIGNFIRDGLNGGPIMIQGDGTPNRSYLYAADLAIWLWTILAKGRSNYPYNVGSERMLTIREIAQLVADHFERTSVIVSQSPSLNANPARYVPWTHRSRSELGLTEKIHLEMAVQKTIQWHLKIMPLAAENLG